MLLSTAALATTFLTAPMPPAATAAPPQPGGAHRTRPEPRSRGGTSQWLDRLITIVNEGSGFEAWKEREAMRLRIEIELHPPAPAADENGDEVESESTADSEGEDASGQNSVLQGIVTLETSSRKLRFDLDDGHSFLVGREEIVVWRRDAADTTLTREDVSNEALNIARALPYLIALPLHINDDRAAFGPGGMRSILDELLFVSVLVVRDPVSFAESDDDESQQVADRPRAYPEDWYTFFVRRREPFHLRVIAYLVHDRSVPIREFPRPRAVVLDDYEVVEGVSLARTWSIHNFSRVDGLGAKIGRAAISEIEFIDREPAAFEAPSGALRLR